MEVRGLSQGGQVSLDNIPKSDLNSTSNTTDSVNVQTEVSAQSVAVQADNGTDNSQTATSTNLNPSEKEVQKALEKLSAFLNDDNTRVEYASHSYFKNDIMIKIINKDTNNVILEVPPKKILDLVAKMMEMVGVLFDKKA